MEPVAATWRGRKGWMIRHRCTRCGQESVNRAAAAEVDAPDDAAELGRLTRTRR
jgi:hypothetical protein